MLGAPARRLREPATRLGRSVAAGGRAAQRLAIHRRNRAAHKRGRSRFSRPPKGVRANIARGRCEFIDSLTGFMPAPGDIGTNPAHFADLARGLLVFCERVEIVLWRRLLVAEADWNHGPFGI